MYPLAEFDGTMKSIDWSKIKKVPDAAAGEAESKWVFPDKFFDQLPAVLADAPPLPGEESRYAQMRALLEAIKSNPALKAPTIKAATEAEEQIVKPLFEFRNWGQQLPHTGARSRTRPPSAPTISRAQRRPSRTFWSMRRMKRNISIRTST